MSELEDITYEEAESARVLVTAARTAMKRIWDRLEASSDPEAVNMRRHAKVAFEVLDESNLKGALDNLVRLALAYVKTPDASRPSS